MLHRIAETSPSCILVYLPVILSFQLRWCCGDRKVQLVEQSYVEREWLLCRDLSWLSCLGGAEASLASLGGTRSKPRRR